MTQQDISLQQEKLFRWCLPRLRSYNEGRDCLSLAPSYFAEQKEGKKWREKGKQNRERKEEGDEMSEDE